MIRVTDSLLQTVENEGAIEQIAAIGVGVDYVDESIPLYYRNCNRIFTSLDFVEIDARRGDRDIARTFRASG